MVPTPRYDMMVFHANTNDLTQYYNLGNATSTAVASIPCGKDHSEKDINTALWKVGLECTVEGVFGKGNDYAVVVVHVSQGNGEKFTSLARMLQDAAWSVECGRAQTGYKNHISALYGLMQDGKPVGIIFPK